MLGRARDPGRDIQVGSNDLASLPDLQFVRGNPGIDRGPSRANRPAQRVSKAPYELLERLSVLQRAASADDDLSLRKVGASAFGLGDGRIDFQRTGGPNDAISRPFINPDGTQNAFDVTGVTPPGGAIDIDVQSEVYGGDALFRKRIECDCDGRLDFLFGYQFSRINEAIDIRTRTTLPPGPPAALNIFDTFDASNEFHAGVLGLQAEFDRGPYVLSVLAKVGLGNMNHTVDISGGGNPAPLQGLLAQTTNIGEHTQDDFAISPEVNLNLGYRATEHLGLSVGYSMIYWSRVVRPGDQIDLVVDTTAPLVNRPAFNFDTTDFWVMGLNFGCQWSY